MRMIVLFAVILCSCKTAPPMRGVTEYLNSPPTAILPARPIVEEAPRQPSHDKAIESLQDQIAILDRKEAALGEELEVLTMPFNQFFCSTGLDEVIERMFARQRELEAIAPGSAELAEINATVEEFEADVKRAVQTAKMIEEITSSLFTIKTERAGLLKQLKQLRAEDAENQPLVRDEAKTE